MLYGLGPIQLFVSASREALTSLLPVNSRVMRRSWSFKTGQLMPLSGRGRGGERERERSLRDLVLVVVVVVGVLSLSSRGDNRFRRRRLTRATRREECGAEMPEHVCLSRTSQSFSLSSINRHDGGERLPRSLSPRSLSPHSPRSLSPRSLSPHSLSPRSLSPHSLSPHSLSPRSLSPRCQAGRRTDVDVMFSEASRR